ncbi:unnamed protein product, partial [Prunus brigantina]
MKQIVTKASSITQKAKNGLETDTMNAEPLERGLAEDIE